MTDGEYDALVVGARVAGSTVAALLGDAGYRVLLIDRAPFPSPTLSTHFFRGAHTLSVLRRLGVLDRVLSLGSPLLTRQYSYTAGREDPAIEPPQQPGDIGYCLSVRREPLDHLLVQRATSSPSVEFLDRTRLGELLRHGEQVVGARLTTPTGARTVRARIVIGADGRHSAVAHAVRAPVEEETAGCRACYYHYVSGFAGQAGRLPDGIETSLREDELAYVFPSDSGLTCVALSINLEEFGWLRVAPDERFRQRFLLHLGFAARFTAAIPHGRVLGCGPEPNYVRVPYGAGWALVGDAGLHQDPWGGHGMDMASMHASFLADALRTWFSGGTSEAAALAQYHAQRNEHGLDTYRFIVSAAHDLRCLLDQHTDVA